MIKTVKKDIWKLVPEGYVIVVPTNGWVNSDGQCAMGRGIAGQAKKLYKKFSYSVGNLIKKHGNSVFYFPRQKLVTFPTKHHWKGNADHLLISQSCEKLKKLMEQNPDMKVAMPKVGCGNGHLKWDDVAPTIERFFGGFPTKRFLIVDNEQGDDDEWKGDNPYNERRDGGKITFVG